VRPRLHVAPAAPPAHASGWPWFAGSLAGLPFAEVLSLLSESLRTGELTITTGPRERTVWLCDGRVVFAASNDPADHLGAVLWRRGLVPLDALERLEGRIEPGRPLGQFLVDEGLLTPAALYDGLVMQVREIVLGAFHEREGAFLFCDGDVPPGPQAAPLPERTRDLVNAGMRRVLEVEELLGEVPDPDRPLQVPAVAPLGLDARAARLLAAAAGAASAREAFHASGLGFHDGMQVLAVLARSGIVSGAPAPPPERSAEPPPFDDQDGPTTVGAGPLETYRRIFKRVFFRMAHVAPAIRERLNSWFEQLSEPERAAFAGVRLDAEGDLDVARVLVNVFAAGREEGPAARAHALAALDAFLAFALFEAKNLLPAEDAASLAAEVARMQGRRES